MRIQINIRTNPDGSVETLGINVEDSGDVTLIHQGHVIILPPGALSDVLAVGNMLNTRAMSALPMLAGPSMQRMIDAATKTFERNNKTDDWKGDQP